VLAASCLVALVGNSYLEAAQAAQQPAGGDARVPARIRLARDLLRLLVGDANPGSTSGFSGGTTPHLCATCRAKPPRELVNEARRATTPSMFSRLNMRHNSLINEQPAGQGPTGKRGGGT
jgi:hypothetical protein